MQIRLSSLGALAVLLMAPVYAQTVSTPSKLAAALASHRQSLRLESGQLTGPGAELLTQDLSDAQFVIAGEDHGIAQIPLFDAAILKILAAHGLERLIVEAGPLTTARLAAIAAQPEPNRALAEFMRQYPVTVPFFSWQEEFDLLRQARASNVKIAGIDQEFIGSPRLLLTELSKQPVSPEAKTYIEELLRKDADGYADAVKTKNFSKLTMMSATNDDVRKLQGLVPGSARPLVDAWALSWEIYHQNQAGQYYVSNRRRAQLMKTNFLEQSGPTAKAMFKLGAFHGYRGLNSMRSAEIGNLVSELAEARGQKSLHILIVAVGGEQARFGGLGGESKASPIDPMKDDDLKSLSPLIEQMKGEDWSLFDVRPLRAVWSTLGVNSTELERTVFGYDLVILIPRATASKDVS